MAVFVFLGPSLPRESAEQHLDAAYLPPVAMGDLYALVETRARAGDHVAIIDGLFERVPAVWHKEILYALSRGVHVYGASSMGALRAAELAAFGMVGVGRVFEAYRDGIIEDDDEVAVSHAAAEHGFRSISLAMASIRFRLADLAGSGILEPGLAETLTARAKAQHYSERNWGDIVGWARELGLEGEALAALRAEGRTADAKAQDAAAMLRHLAAQTESAEPFVPAFVFNHTSYWSALAGSRAAEIAEARQSGGSAPRVGELEAAASYRAGGPLREPLLDAALLDLLVQQQDRGEVDTAELRLASQRIARANGITDAPSLAAWRRAQRLTDAEWRSLVEADARRHRLRAALVDRLDPLLLRALKRSGAFAGWEEGLARVGEAQQQAGLDGMTLEEWGVAPDELEAWYVARHGPMRPDPEAHAMALGFATLRDFLAELLKAYIADRPAGPGA